jgi:hypothetical protein
MVRRWGIFVGLLTAVDFFMIPVVMVVEERENARTSSLHLQHHDYGSENLLIYVVTAMDGLFVLHLCFQLAQVW